MMAVLPASESEQHGFHVCRVLIAFNITHIYYTWKVLLYFRNIYIVCLPLEFGSIFMDFIMLVDLYICCLNITLSRQSSSFSNILILFLNFICSISNFYHCS